MIYDVEGWAFSHNARDLARHAPRGLRGARGPLADGDRNGHPEKALGDDPVDVLYVMHTGTRRPREVHAVAGARGWRPALVGAWSAGWPLYSELFDERYRQVDVLLVNSRIAWDAVGRPERTVYCPLGVNLDVFRVARPIGERRPKVVWVGSEFWREVKGYDDYVVPLGERLAALGIPVEFLLVESRDGPRRTHAQMAEWYNDATVLVCAAETEGTPNPALEAAACGCVVVTTPVGNMPELIRNGENGFLVERSVDRLLEGVLAAIADYPALSRRLQHDIREWGWDRRATVFYDACRLALRRRDLRLAGITAGDPARTR